MEFFLNFTYRTYQFLNKLLTKFFYVRWNTFCRRRIFRTCLCLERALYYSAIYRNKESSQGTLEAETDEARSKDLKMQVTANKEIISIEMSTTNLDLARDRQIRRKTWKHYTDGMNRDRTCASMRHPSPYRDNKSRHLTTEYPHLQKIDASETVTFMLA